MAEAEIQELNERFARGDEPLEHNVVVELQSIMRLHSLTAQDLFFKWESYCIKMDMDEMKLSVESLAALKQDLLDALERSNRTHQVQIKTEKRTGATPRAAAKSNGDVFGMCVIRLASPQHCSANLISGWKEWCRAHRRRESLTRAPPREGILTRHPPCLG
jgi:hypothetical protein